MGGDQSKEGFDWNLCDTSGQNVNQRRAQISQTSSPTAKMNKQFARDSARQMPKGFAGAPGPAGAFRVPPDASPAASGPHGPRGSPSHMMGRDHQAPPGHTYTSAFHTHHTPLEPNVMGPVPSTPTSASGLHSQAPVREAGPPGSPMGSPFASAASESCSLEAWRRIHDSAVLLQSKGRTGIALERFKQALAVQVAVLGWQHQAVGESWENLGVVYLLEGRHGEAAEALEQAKACYSASLGPDSEKVSEVAKRLARCEDPTLQLASC
mmetsp:Transcript_40309/g.100827  ORF Transcript_40309/g.100827 Transcript_40309/m.100827 type:complete len:267 (+) Transcript_40309:79-879(+)